MDMKKNAPGMNEQEQAMGDSHNVRRNVITIGALVLVAALLLVGTLLIPRTPQTPTAGKLDAEIVQVTEAPTAEPTEAPTAEPTAAPAADPTAAPAADATAAPEAAGLPEAEAYLVVTSQGMVYEPFPLQQGGRLTLRQPDGKVNVVEVTRDSIRMVESTCENQDCVEQGVVTLENRETRVLTNMIICLPNDVALELYTQEEVVRMWMGLIEEAEAGE